ncbi:MAG TPA: methylmalonyl-CoA epimerase [Planctomycetes bacterium]|nr:methylmalonyl-CoA epimerase [Planctomycetota bacterium]HIL38054.1 methylmalonyl-CoA epimerase [Planctomycetota bacterium]
MRGHPDLENPLEIPQSLKGVVCALHHLAIVVPDLAAARGLYEGVLGLAAGEVELVADQKVRVLVLMAGEQRIELVEPTAPDSPVARFLERRGGGLHHLAWRVNDLEQALSILKGRGVRLIDEQPRSGAHKTRIAFLHPAATGGVLMELVEDSSV